MSGERRQEGEREKGGRRGEGEGREIWKAEKGRAIQFCSYLYRATVMVKDGRG